MSTIIKYMNNTYYIVSCLHVYFNFQLFFPLWFWESLQYSQYVKCPISFLCVRIICVCVSRTAWQCFIITKILDTTKQTFSIILRVRASFIERRWHDSCGQSVFSFILFARNHDLTIKLYGRQYTYSLMTITLIQLWKFEIAARRRGPFYPFSHWT